MGTTPRQGVGVGIPLRPVAVEDSLAAVAMVEVAVAATADDSMHQEARSQKSEERLTLART